jgi:hypothetical protein
MDAASCGRITLPGELAGYIVLLLADQAQTEPSIEMNATEVVLYDNGTVRLEGTQGGRARGNLRRLLGEILNVACSVPATLRRISRADSDKSDSLVRELETALIPVNRSAARRGLARLYRDFIRLGAFEAVKTRPSALTETSSHLGDLPRTDVKQGASDVQLNIPIVIEKANELAFTVDVERVPSKEETGEPISVVALPVVIPSMPIPELGFHVEIPDLEVPEKFDRRPALGMAIDDDSITRVDAILAPCDDTVAHEITTEQDDRIPEPIRTTTLVMAKVEPITEQQTTSALPKPEERITAKRRSIIDETSDGIRTTTLVLAEVAPRTCTTWSPEGRESLVEREGREFLEPSVALPLVQLKKRPTLPQTLNEETSIRLETPRLLGESSVNRTDINTRNDFNEVVESEPCDVVFENDASDHATYEAETVNIGRFFVDEPEAFTCDELTVIPLGAYELSYVEDPSVTFVEPPVHVGFHEVAPTRSTFYREPRSPKRAILSDPESMVSELNDGSFWEESELCRGLRALAGLELTPQPQPVEITSVSTIEPRVTLRASSR